MEPDVFLLFQLFFSSDLNIRDIQDDVSLDVFTSVELQTGQVEESRGWEAQPSPAEHQDTRRVHSPARGGILSRGTRANQTEVNQRSTDTAGIPTSQLRTEEASWTRGEMSSKTH